MMRFKIGEIAIITNPDKGVLSGKDWSSFNGEECTVIGINEFYDYTISIYGTKYFVMEYELKKRPNNEELSSWVTVEATCGFVPNKETA